MGNERSSETANSFLLSFRKKGAGRKAPGLDLVPLLFPVSSRWACREASTGVVASGEIGRCSYDSTPLKKSMTKLTAAKAPSAPKKLRVIVSAGFFTFQAKGSRVKAMAA